MYANKHLHFGGDEAPFNAPRRATYNATATGANGALAARPDDDSLNVGATLGDIEDYFQPRTTADAKAEAESILDKLGDGGMVVDIYGNDGKFVSVLFVRDDTTGVTANAGDGVKSVITTTLKTAS